MPALFRDTGVPGGTIESPTYTVWTGDPRKYSNRMRLIIELLLVYNSIFHAFSGCTKLTVSLTQENVPLLLQLGRVGHKQILS